MKKILADNPRRVAPEPDREPIQGSMRPFWDKIASGRGIIGDVLASDSNGTNK